MTVVATHFLAKLAMLRGALASVALSHEVACKCDVCRASHGDEEAFQRLLLTLNEETLGQL